MAFSFALIGVASPVAHAARDISPQRECSNCHIMWLTDFNRTDVTTLIPYNPRPVVETGKQDIVSSDRMCFSCHDGFVLDSRFVWQNRQNFHPIGVKPSNRIRIPTEQGKRVFPMNDDGKVYCGTCHSAHGVEWGSKESPIFLRMKHVESSMCIACHLERSTGPDEGNHPIFKKLNELPERLVDAGAKFSKSKGVTCQSCHRIHGAPEKKLLVVNNENSALCGTCHADRYAGSLAEAGRKGTHPVNVTPTKVHIPQELLDRGGKLGSGGTIICQTCHRPHDAVEGAKILVERNVQSSLCKTCHLDQRKVANTKHNLELTDGAIKNIRGQEVSNGGVCSACHVPHNGRGPKMWARAVDPDVEPMSGICLSCHSSGNPAEKLQVGEFTHPVGRDMFRLGQPVDLPGYSLEGVKSVKTQQGRVTCASCHDPHQWDPLDPEKTSKPGDKSDSTNKFLRKPYGPDAGLCRTCHTSKESIRNTKHDMAVMFPAERNIKGQTPAEAGICATCHLPHNGKGARMWAREPLAGVDPVSSACLSCHNPKGVAKERSIGDNSHPVDAPIANLGITANGEKWVSKYQPPGKEQPIKPLPLYDGKGAHVTEGGNVTCGTCHDPHTWSPLAKGSPSGDPRQSTGSGETRFLRLPNDNKATLCANCHVDKGPIALSKHNLAISAPAEKNTKGKPVAETGVCGACHLPHNGNGAKMWARATGEGKDGVEKLCRDCHREGGIAGKKLTGVNSHPLQVDLKKVGGQTTLPLYTAEGKKDSANGKVSCATCHNLHQWYGPDAGTKAGADAKVEGDASNSFLRLPAAPNPELCANCHRDKRWVKNTDHDLAITAPTERNVMGETAARSGVCGQCHLVHNAAESARLWAKPMGPANDTMERLCRSCHSDGKAAAAKQPVRANHPPSVNAVATAGRARAGQTGEEQFPLFTKDGKKVASGIITCPTCHNPHQWVAGKAEEGPGKPTEGDARSSFLRNASDFILCADCHGMDALFRYKYFHGETSRKKHQLYR